MSLLAFLLWLGAEPASPTSMAPAPSAAPAARPAEVDRGRVARKFKMPAGRELRGDLVLQIQVEANGHVGGLQVPAELPDDVVDALGRAVAACAMAPALGPGGVRSGGLVNLTISFKDPAATEAVVLAPPLKQGPRQERTTCVIEQLKPKAPFNTVWVDLAVSETGEPSDFDFGTGDVPSVLREQITEAMMNCRWRPAIDLGGTPVKGRATISIRHK
jgi:hypothetical protein